MDATTSFETWALPNPVKDALSKQGIVTPSKIQELVIPAALEGKDLLGHAINGTGKTLAYCLPLISLLDKDENRDKIGLVLAPNEDAAHQVNDVIKKLTSKMTGRWKPVLVVDAKNIGAQEEGLRRRPRMIVATPDRLIGHINSGIAKLDNVKFVVLEDADQIMSEHNDCIDNILGVIPNERQTMFFTCNLEKTVEDLASKYLQSPERLEVMEANIPEAVAPANNSNDDEPGRFEALLKGIEANEGGIIAFSRTKFRGRRLAQRLNKAGYPTDCLHSDRSNNQKQNSVNLFVEGQTRILICTDVVLGDVEIPEVKTLVNFDIQTMADAFTAKAKNEDSLDWVKLESAEEWTELQAAIAAAGKERIEEIKKQKAIARENGELPERPRKKKSNKPMHKKKQRAPHAHAYDEDRQPNFDDMDDDSQIFFQPSVEEQLNQLDSIVKRKVKGGNPELKRQQQHARAAQRFEGVDDSIGNSVGPSPRRKKARSGGSRGGRGGNYYS